MNDDIEISSIIHELFQSHADGIFRYARSILPPDIDPEDVVQEVFLRAFQSWGTFQGKSSAKTWLFSIARNYTYDLLRKRKVESVHSSHEQHAMSMLCTRDTSQLEIEDLFKSLPLRYRQVLILRAMEGFSVKEVSTALGWTQSGVRITYYRARRRLSNLLTQAGGPNYFAPAKGGTIGD